MYLVNMPKKYYGIKRNTLTIFYTKSNDTKGDNAYEKNIFK